MTSGGRLIVVRHGDRWAVTGDTWSNTDIAREVPGLTWNSRTRAVEGRGDAIETYLRRAAAVHSTEIVGELPTPPAVPSFEGTADGLQQFGSVWCEAHGFDGAILADPTGAGKSKQAIFAANRQTRKLVISPAFLRTNWIAEIAKWFPNAKSDIARTRNFDRIRADAEWVVTNYESLLNEGLYEELRSGGFGAVIFDEAHAVKNLNTSNPAKRAVLSARLAASIPWRLALTATPVWNRRKDIWGISEVVRPGGFGRFWPFAIRYLQARKLEFGWDMDGPYPNDPLYQEVTAELADRMRWFVLRRENLTQLLVGQAKGARQFIWVDPPPGEHPIVPDGPFGFNAALRQTASWKARSAAEIASNYREVGENVLIFTWTREQARVIGLKLNAPIITGARTDDERKAALRQGELSGCLVATLDSLGQGVNLPWVTVTLFADMDWLPLKLLQAEGRSWRIGRTKPPQYVYLGVRGTVDKLVLDTVVSKLDTHSHLLADDSAAALGSTLRVETQDMVLESLLAKLKDEGLGPLPELEIPNE